MAISDLPIFINDNYEVHEWRHATAVLAKDFPNEWDDLVAVLTAFRLKKSYITNPGGNKSRLAKDIDAHFHSLGWVEKQFDTEIRVDANTMKSPTHKVDQYKNKIAIELEWNNKDPFFDRDLNNFRLLFDLRAISVGVIITRCDELQEIFNKLHRKGAAGNSTTHMGKLLPRLEGGSGGGCPILVFGIRSKLYDPDL